MLHPQTLIFPSLLQFWSKTCWGEQEPFAAWCSFSPSNAGSEFDLREMCVLQA